MPITRGDEYDHNAWGMVCPVCGSKGPFDINVSVRIRYFPSGRMGKVDDFEVYDDDPCMCVACLEDDAACEERGICDIADYVVADFKKAAGSPAEPQERS